MLKIDSEKCNACGLCVKSCPFGTIAVIDEVAQANDLCTLCGACLNVCPQAALEIERRKVSREELSQYQGVFIWAECESRGAQDTPKKVAYEILTQGRRMADQLGEPLCAVVLGHDRLIEMESLCYQGADRVLCCRHELLGRYSSDGFTNVLSAVIAKEKPSIFLYGATPNGRDLAPRVAARMHLGLTADCTELAIDEQGQLIQTRPAFGGNIMATIISPYTRPQTATVRANVFAAAESNPTRPVVIEEVPVTLNKANIRTRLNPAKKKLMQPGYWYPPAAAARIKSTWIRSVNWPANWAEPWPAHVRLWSWAGFHTACKSGNPEPRSGRIFTSPSASVVLSSMWSA